MLVVKVKKGQIEKALKELKGKVINTKQNSFLIERKEFKKKSVLKRQILNNAKHKERFSNL